MRLQGSSSKGDLKLAFSNLRLLSFLFIFFIFLISGTTVLIIATQTKDNIISLTRDEMQSKAAIAALQIDGDALDALGPGDEAAPSYFAVRDQLRAIRQSDRDIRYIYTMRKHGADVVYVVDADYWFTPGAARIGQVFNDQNPDLVAGFAAPAADHDFTTGSEGAVLSGYAPVRNSSGQVVGIIGIDMDETMVFDRIRYLNGVFYLVGILSILAAVVGIVVIERRRSIDEELIMAGRNYLTQIFETVQAGILIVDAKTHEIVDANPAALAMFGMRKEDVIGRVCHRFICPEDSGRCPITDLGESVHHSETCILDADMRQVPVIKYVLPIVLDGKPRLLETFIDITDRKKAEEDLVAAVRKLKVLSVVTRNDIISDIYALAGYIDLIKEDLPAMSGHPLEKKIYWVIERIRHKSEFFRDYDEAGTKEPVWQDVSGVVDSAVGQLSTTRLSVHKNPGHLSVFSDQLFFKVFASLLDNTLRHGVHATDVTIAWRAMPDKTLSITYEDNGVGINPADKERIFERGIGVSTGLGLFLAKEILGITGITIRECGEPGKGARFEMIVPEGKYRFGVTADQQKGGT